MEKTNTKNFDAKELSNRIYTEEVGFHGNAFHLDETSNETRQKDLYELLDFYFQRLDFIENHDYDQNRIPEISLHSKEYQNIRNHTYENILTILSQKNIPLENIKTIEITTNGILKVISKSDNQEIVVNLIETWNHNLTEKTKSETKELRDDISKEAFYGGNIIFEYAPEVIAGGIIVGGITQANVSLVSMVVQTENGKKRIHFKKPYNGDPKVLSESMEKILKSNHLEYDPKTKTVYNPTQKAGIETFEKIQKLSYEEAKKIKDFNLTEEEFKAEKAEFLRQNNNIWRRLKGEFSPKNILKEIVPTSFGQAVFWPVFFSNSHISQAPTDVLQSLTEVVLFHKGAKIGEKIGKPFGVAKWIFPIVTGGTAAFGGHYAMDNLLEINRQKWKYFQKANYADGKNAIVHSLTGLYIPEALDGVNYLANKGCEIIGRDCKAGIDFGIPSINFSAFGYHLKTPELTWVQYSITLGTNPWDWVGASASRTVEQWNEQVDAYQKTANKRVYTILGDYFHDRNAFSDKNKVAKHGKEKILQNELYEELLGGQMSSLYFAQIKKIVDGILVELPNFDKNKIPNSTIDELLRNHINMIKIDDFFIKERKQARTFETIHISTAINNLPISEEEKNYIKLLPNRMQENRQLYENDSEKLIYERLIESETIITIEEQQTTLGKYFAELLNKMLDLKNEKYFLDRVEQGDTDGTKWNFIPYYLQ